VLVNYGFAGQAEIRYNQVYVQRRFLGWANFLFDPTSPLWGNDLLQQHRLDVQRRPRQPRHVSNAQFVRA
jgi:phosphonate transport system permease protein